MIFFYKKYFLVNIKSGDKMKTILMTGARSGIAADVIKKIKTKNYKIYVAVHTDTQCKRIKKIYKNDKNIYCIKLDVTDKENIKKLNKIDVDILISSAAIGDGGSISEIKMDKVRENFEVNMFSNFEIVQIVIKNMIKKDSGKINDKIFLLSDLIVPKKSNISISGNRFIDTIFIFNFYLINRFVFVSTFFYNCI